jgi:hypothetical protein
MAQCSQYEPETLSVNEVTTQALKDFAAWDSKQRSRIGIFFLFPLRTIT